MGGLAVLTSGGIITRTRTLESAMLPWLSKQHSLFGGVGELESTMEALRQPRGLRHVLSQALKITNLRRKWLSL